MREHTDETVLKSRTIVEDRSGEHHAWHPPG